MIGQTWIYVNMMIKTQLQKEKESKLSKSYHLNGQDSFVFIFYFFVIEFQLQHGPRCPIGAKTKSTQSQSYGDRIPF
jgi:hypothetical protein